jgi:tetratricopeptide (TPR) repeat protein
MFHDSAGYYYSQHTPKRELAIHHYQSALSVATLSGNRGPQCDALYRFAWIKWQLGDYLASQAHAHECQRLARISGHLHREAQALRIEAMCCAELGAYTQAISLCSRGRSDLKLCGLPNGDLERGLLNVQAEVHRFKSEYVEARNIHAQILQETSADQDTYNYALALLSVSEIDVVVAPCEDVRMNLEAAKSIFNTMGDLRLAQLCDVALAELKLGERDRATAETVFQKTLSASLGKWSDISLHCLERLGDGSRWNLSNDIPPTWTTVYFAQCLKSKQKLGVYKALQFTADSFLRQSDEDTAISLFTVALEGFTGMDVHQSRGECMLRLGDISKGRGDLLRAVSFWETARPLFQRSSQEKQVGNVDERLTGIPEHVKQHNLARVDELETTSGTVTEVEEDLDEVEDLDDKNVVEHDHVSI